MRREREKEREKERESEKREIVEDDQCNVQTCLDTRREADAQEARHF